MKKNKRYSNEIELITTKYKDIHGYISNLKGLYYELIEILDIKDAICIIEKIYNDNITIYNSKKQQNNELQKIQKKKTNITLTEYENQEVIEEKETYSISKNNTDLEQLYGSYIEVMINNVDNDIFLDLLPNSNSREDINEIDKILTICLNKINELRYLLSDDDDEYLLIDLEHLNIIYNKILEYKNSLLCSEEKEIQKNEIIYYMNGNEPYALTDIKHAPILFIPVYELIMSIVNSNFKKIKYFSNDEKIKGLLEVRDTFNRVRVLFEAIGNRKYVIIGVITNKTETNSIYKERLVTRYKKYQKQKENISEEKNYMLLTKLKGDD